jgi:hypothetical protein
VHTRQGEPGGKSLLQDLVIYYTACEARTLTNNQKFIMILDSNREMGLDLIIKLVR